MIDEEDDNDDGEAVGFEGSAQTLEIPILCLVAEFWGLLLLARMLRCGDEMVKLGF